MAKRYFWLKLKEDFFKTKEMRKLRRIAGGDTYSIIYLKLILLSVKTEGKIYYENVEDTFIQELSYELDEKECNVELCLDFLVKYKLIEFCSDNEFSIEYSINNIGSESDSAERVRKLRERKTLHCNEKMLLGNEKMLPSNTCVTKCNTEQEQEQHTDLQTNLEQHQQAENTVVEKNVAAVSEIDSITLESIQKKIENIGSISKGTVKNLIEKNGIDRVNLYLDNFDKFNVTKNPIGFLIKAIENAYDIPAAVKKNNGQPVQSNNFTQREIDDEEAEILENWEMMNEEEREKARSLLKIKKGYSL
jgi:predicted phage replisome organizer